MKEVTTNITEKLILKIGHDGWTSGCGYDGSDVWNDKIYCDTPEEIAIQLAKDYGSFNPGNEWKFYKAEVLEYNGQRFETGIIEEYTLYASEFSQREKYKELVCIWNSDEIQNLVKEKKERERKKHEELEKNKLEEQRKETEKKEKEQLAELLKKYGNK